MAIRGSRESLGMPRAKNGPRVTPIAPVVSNLPRLPWQNNGRLFRVSVVPTGETPPSSCAQELGPSAHA